jgi:16S rRNA (adenine1518-N6/adenine1519-N6)-dimethyltransferase
VLNYDSPNAIITFLREQNLSVQKKFGQNFLINRVARNMLIDSLELKNGDKVWEIGPGLGAMTKILLERGAEVCAFELDHGFCAVLQEFFGTCAEFSLVEGDILKVIKKIPPDNSCGILLLGNLPYNIAAKLLATMTEHKLFFERMVITVQKEVAERIISQPGTTSYAPISILLSRAYKIKKICTLKGSSFFPIPNVDSIVLQFNLKSNARASPPPDSFYPLLRALFSSRRKNIKNNLEAFVFSNYKIHLAEELLNSCGIKHNERAERLNCDDFERLAKLLDDLLKQSDNFTSV